MLLQLQKDMIAKAFAQDKQLVLLIFRMGLEHGDEDTVRYIAEQYAEHYDSTTQQKMQEIIALIDKEQETVH